MELRNPNKSHYPLVLGLLDRCFKPSWQAQALADRIYYEPHYDPSHVWMAREEGKVLGFLVTTLDGDRAWLKLLAVDPDARQKGLATDMLSRAEYRLSGEGATSLRVESTPPFEFLPGVLPASEAEHFFRSQGYASKPQEFSWVPLSSGVATPSVTEFDKAEAAAFGVARAGAAWPWVEETLGFQPARMAYLKGVGLVLAEPGSSLGPLWLDMSATSEGMDALIGQARAIAESQTVLDPRGLRFWQVPGSAAWPVGLPVHKQNYFNFSKTLV